MNDKDIADYGVIGNSLTLALIGIDGSVDRYPLRKVGAPADRRSFTQHYDTDALDASVLRIPLVGFLAIDDPRMTSTIAAIEEGLLQNGVMLRCTVDDGLAGQEHGFLICLFWYLSCLVRQQRFEEVESYLRRMPQISNHLGLFGEQYDPRFRQLTGNLPQAFSHTLSGIEHGVLRQNAVPPWRIRRRFQSGDPRLKDCVTHLDPRIHFALVCASRTCPPPIEAYEADRVNAQLDTSSQVFINATTIAD